MFISIQRWSLHDGPGIRTTVFFKGCPLRCRWCSNPESWNFEKQLVLSKSKCKLCNTCVELCPQKATVNVGKQMTINPDKCDLCLSCVKACPTSAREIVGLDLSVDDILKIVKRDAVFYRVSGGGISFSGGEPFAQIDVLNALVEKCTYAGIHTSVETSGYFPLDKVKKTLDMINHIYIDCKHINDITHKKLTGVSNQVIIQNIIDIDRLGKPIILRIPLVKELTDTDENIEGIAKMAQKLNNLSFIELIPYHDLGASKYLNLGIKYDMSMTQSEKKENITTIFNNLGIKCL
jgi:pyruvate formate lyase activating enzyme